MHQPFRIATIVFAIIASRDALATDYLTHSASEITSALVNVQPGDTIIMADGTWTDQHINFNKNGTAAGAITLRAQTPGRVILNGTSTLSVSGDYNIVDGLEFKDGALTGGNIAAITSSASNSRITNCAFIDYNAADINTDYNWVRVDGDHNRVDHNFFKGKSTSGRMLEVQPTVGSQHQIDDNQFVDHLPGNGNGFETLRIGLSSIQTRSAQALVQRNLFERCDGELEIISNKSSNNLFLGNTFRASKGTLTLRHGQGSTVDGNFFLGENVSGTGGVRVIGPNQTVQNNYFQDLDTNAISLTTGYSNWDVNTTATGYEPVTNALIAHNTFYNITDQVVTRDAGYTSDPTSTRNVRPTDVKMVNNVMYSTAATMIQGTEGSNWTWAGNYAFGTTVGKSGSGIINVNPNLVKDASGLYRPAANSPVINNAASGAWTAPTTDMDGQPRTAPLDAGADEISNAPVTNRPLYGGDVGPDWLKRRTLNTSISSKPIIVMEAEDYTALRDPNGNGLTWTINTSPQASGGAFLKAPPGARTDITGTTPPSAQDAVVEYDVAFHDAGTYYLYILCRGPDSGSNSIYSPVNLGDEPTVNQTLPDNGQWAWVLLSSYNIAAAQVNRPITVEIGRRERDAEIDELLFSPVQLTLSVPEPAWMAVFVMPLFASRSGNSRARRRRAADNPSAAHNCRIHST
jgi:poly(beta-D-mannuronate) lyase